MMRLPKHVNDVELAVQCQAQGLSVRPLSRYYIGETDVRGLVVGFAYVDTNDLVDCGQRLGAVIKAVLDG
jgi:GntR family transcriptional regulator / MocR family aminotransferase